MKGNTAEVLRDYLDKLPWNQRNCQDARKDLSAATGVSEMTIRTWHKDGILPTGIVLIKLRYFLEKQGYEVEELLALKREYYELGKLVADNVISLTDLQTYLGYAGAKQLYPLLFGKNEASPDKLAKIQDLLKDPHAAPQQPADLETPEEKAPEENQPPAEMPDETAIPAKFDGVIPLMEILKQTCALLQPKIEGLIDDDSLQAERRALREEAGRRLVFDLANEVSNVDLLLNALCSERAREQLKKQMPRR